MKQLIHNGISIPKYVAKGFHILYNGEKLNLSPEQEEMAVAWVKKLETEYVQDETFVKNFSRDYLSALARETINFNDLDFTPIIQYITAERTRKLAMSRDERKHLAQERASVREANKAKFGYAWLDGERVEISNYVAEPSSIFMGRGKHPMRGRWKVGPQTNDVVLNLSPEAPRPEGNWKDIVWNPNAMWIARWQDKLSGKTKYVWFS
ncbi:MAG: DNA topoisomerase I, partial [Candidatus Bathyarchaeota archaeon]